MKNIEWQDDRDIYGRMLLLTDSYLFTGLRNAVDNYNADLTDALTWGQLKSKRWLISELEKLDIDLGTIFICAGWYAILAGMLFESKCKITKIRSFDVDNLSTDIADTINRKYVVDGWKFKALEKDIHELVYDKFSWTFWSTKNNRMSYPIIDIANTIINTSCEHIVDFDRWYSKIPQGILCILQTNNFYDVDDHINCSRSLADFANATPMSKVLFEGELVLKHYNRYMRIGYK